MYLEDIRPFARFVRHLEISESSTFPAFLPMDARLFYTLSGCGQILVDGQIFTMPVGSAFYINAKCAYQILPSNVVYLAVNFDFTFDHAMLDIPIPPLNAGNVCSIAHADLLKFQNAPCFDTYCFFPHAYALQQAFLNLEQEYINKMIFHKQACSYILASILTQLARLSEQRQSKEDLLDITQIITYIQDHYAEPLDNQRISEHFHFHSNYISSEFKRNIGKSLHQYVLETRMLNAAALIEAGHRDIAVIASRTGFSDPNYFARYFKKIFNLTPSQYIQNYKL